MEPKLWPWLPSSPLYSPHSRHALQCCCCRHVSQLVYAPSLFPRKILPIPQLIHICCLCMVSHTPHDSDSSSEVILHLLTCIKDCLSMLEDLKQYWWFLGGIRLTVFSYWCHVHRGGRAPFVCRLQLLAIQCVWCHFWCKDFIIVELVKSLVHNNLFQVIQFLLLLAMTDSL